MLYFLFSFIHSRILLSDVLIRIPTYVKEEGSYPYHFVTCFSPDCTFKSNDTDLIELDIVERNSTITLVKIISKCPIPADTQVIATSGKESVKITVHIDNIYYLKILTTSGYLCVNCLGPIKLVAYNKDFLTFSSIKGTIIEWGPDIPDRPFDFIDPQNSKIKLDYDYDITNIIQPTKNATINITCRLVYRKEAKPANQKFSFIYSIAFDPKILYMIPGTEYQSHLYYGEIKNDYVYPNKDKEIDLSNDLFSIESFDKFVATNTQDGIIKALKVGETTIIARENKVHSNFNTMTVKVVIPDSIEYDEQWIKTSDQNDHNTLDLSSIKLFYNEKPVFLPDDLEIVASDEWKNAGTHNVKVEIKNAFLEKINKNLTFEVTVHTCPPPKVEPSHIYIHDLFNDEIKFNVLGGSGQFDYQYIPVYNKDESKPVEQEDGTILSLHTLSMNYKNKAEIVIVDRLIPDYKTSVVIEFDQKKSDDL